MSAEAGVDEADWNAEVPRAGSSKDDDRVGDVGGEAVVGLFPPQELVLTNEAAAVYVVVCLVVEAVDKEPFTDEVAVECGIANDVVGDWSSEGKVKVCRHVQGAVLCVATDGSGSRGGQQC